MRHVMIDIETLDTASTAVILSIAAVEFDGERLGARFHQRVSIDSCLKHGLTVSGNTIEWWMEQSDEARRIFRQVGLPLGNALANLSQWLGWDGVDEVWSNGSDFDFPILANAFRAVGAGNPPWSYFKLRDYRTIRKMYPKEVLDAVTVKPEIAHDAFEDACAQALTLQALLASGHSLQRMAA